jgi:polyisoprenyl-phosphate glycosyltransferase
MLSIVIPILNEEASLPSLYARLSEAAKAWDTAYEVVLVNDGSTDETLAVMRNLVAEDPRWRVVSLARNFGHQQAISAGLAHARGDAVVVMDGDLQDPPEAIGTFLSRWREGWQVVYAVRVQRKEGLFKRASYRLFYRVLNSLSPFNIPLDSGDFCLMDKRVVNVLRHDMPEQLRFVRGLRAYAGFRQTGVPVERDARAIGKPKYTYRKLLGLALNGIFGFSTVPLRISTWLGLFAAGVSLLMGIFFIVHRIVGFKVLGHSPDETPGLTTLAVVTFFMGGVILTSLGILGEYIGRIYTEVKRRPAYVVDEVIEHKEG